MKIKKKLSETQPLNRRVLLQRGAITGIGIAGASALAHFGFAAAEGNATPNAASAIASPSVSSLNAGIVSAANAFLATLSDDETSAVLFDWTDTAQRQRWSNFPEGLFQRDGLMWGNLSESAQNAWLALMQATMSAEGYDRVSKEWAADDALAAESGGANSAPVTGNSDGATPVAGQSGSNQSSQGNPPQFAAGASGTPQSGGPGNGGPQFGGASDGTPQAGGPGNGGGMQMDYGKKYYWVAIIGQPSDTDPWQWQWGGHHVTVNATIMGDNIALTPSFIGVQPATYTDADGNTVRPLGDIWDEAVALLTSLDADQQSQAILGNTYVDLVLGPGEDGKTLQPEGLPGSNLTSAQQTALLHLVAHYTGLVNDAHAAARQADVAATIDDLYFVWYGPVDAAGPAYFRVSGPNIVIEYSPQGLGGNAAEHIHGIYRDPTNDYGSSFTGITLES